MSQIGFREMTAVAGQCRQDESVSPPRKCDSLLSNWFGPPQRRVGQRMLASRSDHELSSSGMRSSTIQQSEDNHIRVANLEGDRHGLLPRENY